MHRCPKIVLYVVGVRSREVRKCSRVRRVNSEGAERTSLRSPMFRAMVPDLLAHGAVQGGMVITKARWIRFFWGDRDLDLVR